MVNQTERRIVDEESVPAEEKIVSIFEEHTDIIFHKRAGLNIADMVKSSWIYKKLRNFRAGIEGIISFLKRAFGVGQSRSEPLEGLRSFKACAMSAVVSANLLTLARHALV